MNVYEAHTKYLGYSIGLRGNDAEKEFIGVPEKKLTHTCQVKWCPKDKNGEYKYTGQYMMIEKGRKPIKRYFQEGKINDQGIKIAPDFWLAYFPVEFYQKKAKKEEIATVTNYLQTLTLEQIREMKEKVFKKV